MNRNEILYLAERAGVTGDSDPESLVAFANLVATLERRECHSAVMGALSKSENWDTKNGVMYAANAITARGGVYE